ncbi:hypothetical protein C8Q80DRAFT_907439 [Daedaleopsis nitida]|nr:hypothetical protein C8Q80DRAFT_907439 [Daedaleopsis nitida]
MPARTRMEARLQAGRRHGRAGRRGVCRHWGLPCRCPPLMTLAGAAPRLSAILSERAGGSLDAGRVLPVRRRPCTGCSCRSVSRPSKQAARGPRRLFENPDRLDEHAPFGHGSRTSATCPTGPQVTYIYYVPVRSSRPSCACIAATQAQTLYNIDACGALQEGRTPTCPQPRLERAPPQVCTDAAAVGMPYNKYIACAQSRSGFW